MKQNLGELYDKTSDFQQSQFDYFTKLMTKYMPTQKIHALLDIGSGTGKRTKDCFQIFPNLDRITALEPDPDMHKQAIEFHADPRIDYLKKSASYIEHMNSRKIEYNLILSHWTMHWIKDKEVLMSNLNNVLDEYKESYLAFSTCEALPQILQDVDTYIRIELGIPLMGENPFYYYNRRQWENLLTKNGWKIRIVENFPVAHEAADCLKYLEHWFASSTAKFMYNRDMSKISGNVLEDLLDLMEHKYGVEGNNRALRFNEDVIFMIAER